MSPEYRGPELLRFCGAQGHSWVVTLTRHGVELIRGEFSLPVNAVQEYDECNNPTTPAQIYHAFVRRNGAGDVYAHGWMRVSRNAAAKRKLP